MKSKFIGDLQERDRLDNEPFLISDVLRRTTKDGRPYLLCVFSDKSGQVSGVFWDVPDHLDAWVRPGLPVLVTGQVHRYRDALQINATDLNRWLTPDMTLFLPTSQRPVPEMVHELRERVAALQQPWQRLVAAVLLEPDFLRRFATAPAARQMHHAYVGGLLEHTLSMAKLAEQVAQHYSYVNLDLLLAGVLLHDAGKVAEYEVDADFSFSEDGRLVGHIVRGIIMLETAAGQLEDVPPADLRQLTHLIASHHGTLEWGSPVVPKTIEAVLLHQLDLLDSRVQGFLDHLRQDAGDEPWSVKRSAMFNTELRRPDGFEDESE